MGVGKSTVGKKLAKRLGYTFYDLDKAFEEKYKISINDFFGKYDENLFRALEQEQLQETFQQKRLVVATGGGTACYHDSMESINHNGLSIYLKMKPSALSQRLKMAKKKRPLIEGLNEEQLIDFIQRKLREREVYYNKAQWTVQAINLDIKALAEKIVKQQSS